MGTFRCLKSKSTINENTGTDLGTSITTTFTLPNTPIIAGTLTGTVYQGNSAVQTFVVDETGTFTFSSHNGLTDYVTDGSLNLNTGVMTLTWNNAPGANHSIVTYKGIPVYQFLTMRRFYAKCPKINQLCSSQSNAYVAAPTICDQGLYT